MGGLKTSEGMEKILEQPEPEGAPKCSESLTLECWNRHSVGNQGKPLSLMTLVETSQTGEPAVVVASREY